MTFEQRLEKMRELVTWKLSRVAGTVNSKMRAPVLRDWTMKGATFQPGEHREFWPVR